MVKGSLHFSRNNAGISSGPESALESISSIAVMISSTENFSISSEKGSLTGGCSKEAADKSASEGLLKTAFVKDLLNLLEMF